MDMGGAPMAAGSGSDAPNAMAGSMEGMGGMFKCDGSPTPDRQGNLQGHALPGTIFIVWGLHWMISASWRHLMATRAGRAYRVQSTEGLLPMIPALKGFNSYPVESLLKAVCAFLLFFLQVTYGGYKYLVCPSGVRDGRLATQHLNSWSHATMNLGYMLSGVVELLGLRSRLPEGINQAFLSGGFLIEALLFSMHEKNGHLDQTTHFLLAQAGWAGAAFTALEAAFPSCFMLTAGRAFAMVLQGTWFWQSGHILFRGGTFWDDQYRGMEDEAPAMFLPMIFVYHMLFISVLLVSVYAFLEWLHSRMLPDGTTAHAAREDVVGYVETSRLLTEEEDGFGMKSVPLANMQNGLRRG